MALAHPLAPYLFTGLIGYAYFRRIAGSFGRRPWRPVRVGVRLGLLSLALLSLGLAAVVVPGADLAVGAGAAVGAILAAVGLRFTHAEWLEGERCYTPNPWIGGALSLLLVGRLLFRMGSGALADGGAMFTQKASPMTLGIAAVLVTYYVVNSIGLFVQMARLARSAPEPVTPAVTGTPPQSLE
jgi:hypothetical protein